MACSVVDYTRHEVECPHPERRHRRTRWRTADGCTNDVCDECLYELGIVMWSDLVAVTMLGSDRLPLSPDGDTESDRAVREALLVVEVLGAMGVFRE